MTRADRVLVGAATVMVGCVTVLWVLLLPPFRAADEAPYTSSAIRLAIGGGYPQPGTVLLDEGVRASYDVLGHAAPGSGRPVGPLPPREPVPLPSWSELRAQGWALDPIFDHDQVSQHPPAWAVWLAAVARLLRLDDVPVDGALLALRLASAAPLLLKPWLVVRCGLLVGVPRAAVWVAAVIPAGWPRLTEISAGVSNTPLTIVTCTVVLWLALRTSRGWVGVLPGLLTGLALGFALLVKGLAFATLPGVALALVLAARRQGLRPVVVHGAALAAASLSGLSWWIRNLVVVGVWQPNGFTAEQNSALNDSGRDLRAVLVDLPLGISRDLWLQPTGDSVLTEALHLVLTGLVVAAAVTLVFSPRAGHAATRARLGLCLLPAPAVVALSAWGALSGTPGVGISVVAHARYVVVAAAGIALVAGMGALLLLRRAAWVSPALLLAVALMAMAVEQTNLWAGESITDRIATMTSWWSVTPLTPWLLAVVGVVGAVVASLHLRSSFSREASLLSHNRGDSAPKPP